MNFLYLKVKCRIFSLSLLGLGCLSSSKLFANEFVSKALKREVLVEVSGNFKMTFAGDKVNPTLKLKNVDDLKKPTLVFEPSSSIDQLKDGGIYWLQTSYGSDLRTSSVLVRLISFDGLRKIPVWFFAKDSRNMESEHISFKDMSKPEEIF